jgi:hypothetical protein
LPGNCDGFKQNAENSLGLAFNCNDLSPFVKTATGTDPVGLLGLTALLAVLQLGQG